MFGFRLPRTPIGLFFRDVVQDPVFVFLLGIGLLVRLLLMPWAMHSDLLSMVWRSTLMAEYGLWQLPTNQLFAHFLYAGNLLVMKLFGAEPAQWFQQPFGLFPGSKTASAGDWLVFLEHPHLNALLFGLKLPHLLADIGVTLGLGTILRKVRNWKLAMLVWWLNPVVIYNGYLFGRHDIFAAAAVLMMMVYLARQQLVRSLLALYLGYQLRVQPMLYVPFVLLTAWKQHQFEYATGAFFKKISVTGVVVLLSLWLLTLLPFNGDLYNELVRKPDFVSTASQMVYTPITWLDRVGVPSFILDKVLDLSSGQVPLFMIVYGAVLFLWWKVTPVTGTFSEQLSKIVGVTIVVTAGFFATTATTPHYFAWLCLPIAVGVAFRRRLLLSYALTVVAWSLHSALNADLTVFTHALFLPASLQLWYVPTVYQTAVALIGGMAVHKLLLLIQLFWSATLVLVMIEAARMFFSKELRQVRAHSSRWLSVRPVTVIVGALLVLVVLVMSKLQTNLPPKTAFVYPFSQHQAQAADPRFVWLEPGQTVTGNVTADSDQLTRVEVRLSTNNNPSYESVIFRIKDSAQNEWWYQSRFVTHTIYSGWYYPVGFPPLLLGSNKTLVWEIEVPAENQNKLGVGDIVPFQPLSRRKRFFIAATDMEQKVASQPVFFALYGAGVLSVTTLLIVYGVWQRYRAS